MNRVEEEIRDLENDILSKALAVVSNTVDFADITEDATEPPQEWIDQMGRKAAEKRFRISKGAWKSHKEAPVGIMVALKISESIVHARSAEKIAPKALSITWIQNQGTPQQPVNAYPEIVVEEPNGE